MGVSENRLMSTVKGLSKLRKNLIWKYFILAIIWHVVGLYGVLTFPHLEKKLTFLWIFVVANLFALGVTGGAHRLWTHRSYKVKLSLRLILIFFYHGNGMFKLSEWVRLHRVHHRYVDTDADPHNSTRGFIFSHLGWVMLKKHPEFLKRYREVNMDDVQADVIARFGDKHFKITTLLICFILPTLVPVYFWNESWYWAIMSQVFIRYLYLAHVTATVNSIAHSWGSRPYNRKIMPAENTMIAVLTLGEGWHNYHHTFPWDYKASEFGNCFLNFTTFFINQFAKIGWAYDLKQPSDDLIKSICKKMGDGSYPLLNEEIREPQ